MKASIPRKSLGLLSLIVLSISLALVPSPALAKTITIKAVFKYLAPDGTVKPIRWALCELRDADEFRDDIIARSVTDEEGAVSFEYDSETDDGWLAGRIDPSVACLSSLIVPLRGQALNKVNVVWTSLTEENSYWAGTETWGNNNEDRTATITVREGDARYAFFMLDCLAEANSRRQRLETPSFEPAPMALSGDVCAGTVSVQFPVTAKTGFLAPLNKIRITSDYKSDFDTIVHEYGHHEMWESYGKSLYGDYNRTQGDHNINGEVDDLWTAFNEAWADFCAVITKGRPEYRGINLEEESAGYTKSDRCEGTICRIFWDVWDTYEDPLFEANGNTITAVPRPRQGRLTLDDDPIGFSDQLPFIGWQGRKTLKKIINDSHPKSIWDFKSAWDRNFAQDGLARRSLEAVFWQHGLHQEITDSAPSCTLTVEGTKDGEAYKGSLVLRANVTDADVTSASPYDMQLMHVAFYWAEYREKEQRLASGDPYGWHCVGVDTNGADGFSCDWPEFTNRPAADKKVCLIALASDFFQDSAFGRKLADFTPAQVGPVTVLPEGGGSTGGGGTGALVPAAVSVSYTHGAAVSRDGTLRSWGSNWKGELGIGRRSLMAERIEAEVTGLLAVKSVATVNNGTAALLQNGTVWVWGGQYLKGKILDPPVVGPQSQEYRATFAMGVPTQIKGLDNVMAIASKGGFLNLALKADGTVWVWFQSLSGVGAKWDDYLGYTESFHIFDNTPYQVMGLSNIVAVAAGIGHGLALDRDGHVWCFGENTHGQLGRQMGQAPPHYEYRPKKVEEVDNVIAIAAGDLHSLAVSREGTVWAWGINERGQLGDGTLINRYEPVQVTGLPSIQAAAGGAYHSVFLGRDGSVWTCGADLGGALGIGGTTWRDWRRPVPVRVLNLADVEAIAAGGQSSLAVCSDGSVWGWGSNSEGELGINNPPEIKTPLRVGTINVY
jgi:alpha-tubulin suppressor-like RCC1 family protein